MSFGEPFHGRVRHGLLMAAAQGLYIPKGLAPQKVVETDEGDPTRDTYQRKVFFDGTNFFVVYWTGSPTKEVRYVASSNGIDWTIPTTIWGFTVAPYYGGNIDLQYPSRGALSAVNTPFDLAMVFSGSNGIYWYFYPFLINGQTLSISTGACSMAAAHAQGGSLITNLFPYPLWVLHREPYFAVGYYAMPLSISTDVSYGGTTTGGAQILPYKTSSPYDVLVLAKGGDNKLYSRRVDQVGTPWLDAFTMIATLGTGFSDFCASSEAQDRGDPELIHLVYIKSTGELAYRKFTNDSWEAETILVESGATYPVIACGNGGRLYVFFVKNGKILVKHYNAVWFSEVELFTVEHTYNNPTYLSSNQNVQDGKICLVWAEGTSAPYEVWFCYLED